MTAKWKPYRGTPFNFGVITLICLLVGHAQSQLPARRFVLDGIHANDPIQAMGFRVSGRLVKPGTDFQADDEEWLKTSSVIVRNDSSRKIMGIWINLFFPEVGNDSGMVGDQVQIGNRASSEQNTKQGTRLHDNDYPSFSLLPGKTYEIPLGTNYEGASALRSRISAGAIPTRCVVRFAAVYFTDGSKWAPGYFARPDLDHPGKFVVISPAEWWGSKQ
jgi:hypothetical protein